MLPAVLILLLATLLGGVLFAIFGFRGRRINDHPVCSWCAFDLDGVYPECVTCPECGAGLKRDKAVRTGVRKRMPVLAVTGLLLIATSLVPFGVVSYAAITGSDINKHKPLGLLLWEGRLADPTRSVKITDELMSRILAGKLAPDQYQKIIATALAIQGDHARPWSEGWGDLIERAHFDGVLSKEDHARFAAQAPVFELFTRPAVFVGGKLPVLVKLKEARVGSTTAMMCPVEIQSLRFADKEIKPQPRAPRADGRADFQLLAPAREGSSVVSLSGSKAGGMRVLGLDNSFGVVADLDDTLAPGTYPLAVTLEATPNDGNDPFGGTVVFMLNGNLQQSPETPTATPQAITLASSVELKPLDQPIASATKPDAETIAKLEKQLRPSQLQLGPGDTPFAHAHADAGYSLTFDCENLPAEVAYDVFVKTPAGDEVLLGSFCSGRSVDRASSPFMTSMRSSFTISINGSTVTSSSSNSREPRTVTGMLPFAPSGTVDVVLRPNPATVGQTLYQSTFADVPLEFKGVPVQKHPFQEMEEQMEQLRRRAFPRGGRVIRIP